MNRTTERLRPVCPLLSKEGEGGKPCFFRVEARCCHAALDDSRECPQQRLGLGFLPPPAKRAG
jgi:hypothetical protein